MKETGMIRPVDRLGRVVIPMEIRRRFNMENEGDCFEIFTEDDKIILKKYKPSCVFCGSLENVFTYNKQVICQDCIERLKKISDLL